MIKGGGMPKRKTRNDTTGTRQAIAPDPDHLARQDTADAFIPDPEGGPARINDDLAESLAEEYLASATSGEDTSDEVLDRVVSEEIGGPFIETTAEDEFATEPDESNPVDAQREPLPRAVHGLAQQPQEESEEEPEED
jgi:hypothetical protein